MDGQDVVEFFQYQQEGRKADHEEARRKNAGQKKQTDYISLHLRKDNIMTIQTIISRINIQKVKDT